MCLVPDVDWCNSVVIQREIYNRPIILQDFRTPFDPMFGYIRFRFPESVKYPCIPVSVEGCLIFPQSSEGLDGVYASGPEIYLVLRLGAEITAVRVYVGTVLVDDDLQISHSLYHTVKQLVVDRKCVQDTIGKGTIPDFLLKTAVTSLYGKTAQDVVEKSSWDAYKEIMQNIGGSRITSPVHACLTTAGVRCCLIAAMNQLNTLDYKYKSIGKSCVVLRTENDWSVFFRKSYAKKGGSEHHIADHDAYAFRQLFTIIMGYRLRMWDIPYLSNNKLSVNQVLDWINKFNPSSRVFKKSDWKNARNAMRAAQMLTMQEVSDLFTKMQCIML